MSDLSPECAPKRTFASAFEFMSPCPGAHSDQEVRIASGAEVGRGMRNRNSDQPRRANQMTVSGSRFACKDFTPPEIACAQRAISGGDSS